MFSMTFLQIFLALPVYVIIIQIPIKKTDDVGGHNMIDPNQVADDLLKTTTSPNDDTRYCHNVCLYC